MVTNNSWNSSVPVPVTNGGTAVSSFNAYSVLCGGTSTTSPVQSISSPGSSGQVLTSNGSSALPTFQNASSSGGSLILIQTLSASNSTNIAFTTGITSTYKNYMIIMNNLVPVTNAVNLTLTVSTNGGSSYLNTGYNSGVWSTNSGGTSGVSNSTTSLFLANSVASGGIPTSGTIYLYNLTNAAEPTISGSLQVNQGISWSVCLPNGRAPTSITVNALSFEFSSGNISTGNFSLYGISQ